jgi:hypothetical protein
MLSADFLLTCARRELGTQHRRRACNFALALAIVLAGRTALSDAANVTIQGEVSSVVYSPLARTTSLEVFLTVAQPGDVSLAAHQVRVQLNDRSTGVAVSMAGQPTAYPYAGPSATPISAVVGNRVDSGDISFTGAVSVGAGAGLLKVTLALPPRLPVGFYPLDISGDAQFTFLADAMGNDIVVRIASGGLNVQSPGVAGDYNGDGRVDGTDALWWQRSVGSRTNLTSDGNGDGVVDSADLLTWQDRFGSGRVVGDFDFNRSIDGGDFLEWQRTLGSTSILTADADGNRRVEFADLSIWKERFGLVPRRGDYNADGVADGADLLLWQRRLGSTTVLTADGNQNGIVDGSDLTIWKADLGGVHVASNSAVPEPTSIVLCALTCVRAICRRRAITVMTSSNLQVALRR